MAERPADAPKGRAVVASVNPYDAPPRGSHYWARWLARQGFAVDYISTPISPFHLARGLTGDLKRRARAYLSGGTEAAPRIRAYVPGTLLPPKPNRLAKGPGLLRDWPRWTLPGLKRRLSAQGPVDFLYCDDPIFCGLPALLNPKRSVYRIIDKLDSHGRGTEEHWAAARLLAQSVDLTVYASRTYAGDAEKLGAKATRYAPNGYENHVFRKPDIAPPPPSDLGAIPEPRAVYVGELGSRFDTALVGALAQALPHMSFVLIGFFVSGRADRAFEALLAQSNVYFLGEKPYESLPAYLWASQAGLIPFKTQDSDPFAAHANPLKLYQYLGAGLPVVAARTPALEALQAPIALTGTTDEAVAALASTLEPVHREDAGARLAFAEQYGFDGLMEALFADLPDLDPRQPFGS